MTYGKFKTIMMWVGIFATLYMFGNTIMWLVQEGALLIEQAKTVVPQ